MAQTVKMEFTEKQAAVVWSGMIQFSVTVSDARRKCKNWGEKCSSCKTDCASMAEAIDEALIVIMNARTYYSEGDRKFIREAFEEGQSVENIADDLGLSDELITKILQEEGKL